MQQRDWRQLRADVIALFWAAVVMLGLFVALTLLIVAFFITEEVP